MKIYLEPYDENTLDDYRRVYSEENGKDSPLGRELRETLMRFAALGPHYHMLAIRRAGDGENVGYCEIVNDEGDAWEVGIYLLERYRFQGVGKEAVPLYLDEISKSCGVSDFTARIRPDNVASIALFEGAGFELVGEEAIDGHLEEVGTAGFMSTGQGASSRFRGRYQVVGGVPSPNGGARPRLRHPLAACR